MGHTPIHNDRDHSLFSGRVVAEDGALRAGHPPGHAGEYDFRQHPLIIQLWEK